MTLVATQVKRRRGTNDENDAFAGAEGEITVDLTNKELRVHDGSGKLGGFRIGRHTDRSNCITEISQDIKLEIGSSNQFIVKAGSKVYFGDGSSATLPSDKSYGASTGFGSEPFMFCIKKSDLSVMQATLNNTSSNATNPNVAYRFWFNKTDGKCYINDGSGVATETSFPVGIVQHTNSVGWTSINQIFNGLGYIGSTVFALPGVKGLYPNGRNTDGTLKSGAINITEVKTYTVTVTTTTTIRLASSGMFGYRNYIISDTRPSSIYSMWYNPVENIMYDTGSGTPSKLNASIAATIIYDGTRITSFVPKTAFHAVDYNDTDFIAHQAMPSNKHIELTLGVSGSSYTAPADGFYVIEQEISATNGFISILNTTNNTAKTLYAPSGFSVFDMLAVSKGDVVKVIYNNIGDTEIFDFVYANGAK